MVKKRMKTIKRKTMKGLDLMEMMRKSSIQRRQPRN